MIACTGAALHWRLWRQCRHGKSSSPVRYGSGRDGMDQAAIARKSAQDVYPLQVLYEGGDRNEMEKELEEWIQSGRFVHKERAVLFPEGTSEASRRRQKP